MQRYPVPVRAVRDEGCEVASLLFGRPEGYDFTPGQWLRLTLETAEGERTETFSHSSAPSDEDLQITTRLSGSAFKRALASLAPGDEVEIAGPAGRLVLPDGLKRVAFLIGGVGITPVRSMLREAFALGRVFDEALLVYGNRDPSCAPFLDEFLGMATIGVRVVQVYEHAAQNWDGERGFITAEVVRRAIGPDDNRPFVVAGPPPMVAAMTRVLDELEIAPERRMIESFGPAVV